MVLKYSKIKMLKHYLSKMLKSIDIVNYILLKNILVPLIASAAAFVTRDVMSSNDPKPFKELF